MFNSLKVKLTLAFGGLIVLLFVLLGVFLVDAKSRELTQDLGSSAQNFARFTAEEVVHLSNKFLDTGSFLVFNREVQGLLRNNTDIEDLNLVDYNGVVQYRLSDELTEQYDGSPRVLSNIDELDRVQAQHLSLQMEDGRVIYVKQDEDGHIEYVDFNEEAVLAPSERDRIANIVMPALETHAVTYNLSYESVDLRLRAAQLQIAVIAALGLLLTLLVSFMLSTSMTKPLKELKAGALKIAKGNFDTRVKVKTKDEIGVLAGTFNQMAKDLKASTEAMLYQERLQKELELAAKIQEGLLPDEKMEMEKMDLAGGLIPASEIGGDAFDYIDMEDGCQLIYLGDVTGHGVPAGIVSSVANAVLFGLRREKDLMDITDHLNQVLREKTTPNVFMTMALTHWDPKKGELTYVNAGHPPVFYYSAEKKKVTEVKLEGIALAFVDDIRPAIKVQKFKMKPGDVVVMYSDGVPEAANKKGEQYGIPRARRIIQGACDDLFTAEGIKNAVLTDVVDYIGKKDRDDDITVVVLKRK